MLLRSGLCTVWCEGSYWLTSLYTRLLVRKETESLSAIQVLSDDHVLIKENASSFLNRKVVVLLRAFPRWRRGHFLYGLNSLSRKQWDATTGAIEALKCLDPDHRNTLFLEGVFYTRISLPEKAIPLLKELTHRYPHSIQYAEEYIAALLAKDEYITVKAELARFPKDTWNSSLHAAESYLKNRNSE